ncbi:MAG: OmpA family protein [Alphaproteobacteria bacterium]|nr:MAG: OmpA family protein [Alphaproteobacteria bacterium]
MLKNILSILIVGLSLAGCACDRNSCAQVGPGSCTDFQQSTAERVHYDYNSASLRADAKDALDGQVAWLAKYPNVSILVEGHCDKRGTREYNLGLGERRAAAVRDYLFSHGVSKERVRIVSYGKERLAVEGDDEQAHTYNRRAVTVVE